MDNYDSAKIDLMAGNTLVNGWLNLTHSVDYLQIENKISFIIGGKDNIKDFHNLITKNIKIFLYNRISERIHKTVFIGYIRSMREYVDNSGFYLQVECEDFFSILREMTFTKPLRIAGKEKAGDVIKKILGSFVDNLKIQIDFGNGLAEKDVLPSTKKVQTVKKDVLQEENNQCKIVETDVKVETNVILDNHKKFNSKIGDAVMPKLIDICHFLNAHMYSYFQGDSELLIIEQPVNSGKDIDKVFSPFATITDQFLSLSISKNIKECTANLLVLGSHTTDIKSVPVKRLIINDIVWNSLSPSKQDEFTNYLYTELGNKSKTPGKLISDALEIIKKSPVDSKGLFTPLPYNTIIVKEEDAGTIRALDQYCFELMKSSQQKSLTIDMEIIGNSLPDSEAVVKNKKSIGADLQFYNAYYNFVHPNMTVKLKIDHANIDNSFFINKVSTHYSKNRITSDLQLLLSGSVVFSYSDKPKKNDYKEELRILKNQLDILKPGEINPTAPVDTDLEEVKRLGKDLENIFKPDTGVYELPTQEISGVYELPPQEL